MSKHYWIVLTIIIASGIGAFLISKETRYAQTEDITPHELIVEHSAPSPAMRPISLPDEATSARLSNMTARLDNKHHQENIPQPSEQLAIGEFIDPDDPDPQYGYQGEQVILGEYIDPDNPAPNQDWDRERLVIGKHVDPEDTSPNYDSERERIVIGEPIDPENSRFTTSDDKEQVILGTYLEPDT